MISPLSKNRILFYALAAVFILYAALYAYVIQNPHFFGQKKGLIDFDAFYFAGLMYFNGNPLGAYDYPTFRAFQQVYTEASGFLVWSYPPQFFVISVGLALVDIGTAFFLFMAFSFILYLYAISRIAGTYRTAILILNVPLIVWVMRTGQNGFLTAGLIGLCLDGFRRRDGRGGIPLGLMIIKPHLGVSIGLTALVGRRWRTVAIAAGTIVVTAAISTFMLGVDAWPAFLGAIKQASAFLQAKAFPIFRMASAYAFLRSIGMDHGPALVAQLGIAAIVIALMTALLRSRVDNAYKLAIAGIASVLISPYTYDYDLMIFGVGLAFVIDKIVDNISLGQAALLTTLYWVAICWGPFQHLNFSGAIVIPGHDYRLSYTFPLILFGIIVLAITIYRARQSRARTDGSTE